MNKKIKTFIRTSLIVFVAIAMFLTFSGTKTFAASSNIYYISASTGETYKEVGINFHSKYENATVRYGTDKYLSNYEEVNSTSILWGVEQSPTDSSTGFPERYVHRALLTNLAENKTYYYQVVANGEKSDIKSFKTVKQNTGVHDILFLADTQSGSLSAFQKVNTVINSLKAKAPNAKLALIAGDIIDRGGYESQWNAYFNGVNAFDDMLLTTVPGNHEYYHDNGAGYIDPSFYNKFFFNPQNGPEGRLNSSYYVKYDNVLFIMLDIINREYIEEHKVWFKQVVEENPSQWIIVMTHAGAYSAGAYAHDASFVSKHFKSIFEECQVDLALSGHEHLYIRKDLEYQGQKNEKLGVTYLVGPAAGQKQYPPQYTTGLDEVIGVNQNYSGNILRFNGDTLTVEWYKENGSLGTSFTLNAKRKATVESVTNAEVEESIKFDFKPEENRIYLSWTDKLWRNATKVELTGTHNWSSPVMSSYSNEHIIKNVYDGAKYDYTFSITMNDGSIVSKSFSLDLGWDTKTFNITYNLDGGTLPSNAPTSYANKDGLETLPTPTKEKYVFKGWYDENGVKYKSIAPDTRKDLELTAVWVRGEKDKNITYILNGGTLPEGAPTTFEMFVGLETLPIPTKDGYTFKGWTRNGEIVTSISDEEERNVILTATWEQNKEETPQPTPQPETPKKGCGKSSAAIMVSTLSAASLLVLLLRKKH